MQRITYKSTVTGNAVSAEQYTAELIGQHTSDKNLPSKQEGRSTEMNAGQSKDADNTISQLAKELNALNGQLQEAIRTFARQSLKKQDEQKRDDEPVKEEEIVRIIDGIISNKADPEPPPPAWRGIESLDWTVVSIKGVVLTLRQLVVYTSIAKSTDGLDHDTLLFYEGTCLGYGVPMALINSIAANVKKLAPYSVLQNILEHPFEIRKFIQQNYNDLV